MASTETIDRTRVAPGDGAEREPRIRRNLRTPTVAMVVLFGMAACVSAGNGPGIAVKMGVQTFESR